MTTEEIKELEKKVSKARFKLSQKAGDLHDLVEDRLPADFEEILGVAEITYKACQEWDLLNKELIKVKKQ